MEEIMNEFALIDEDKLDFDKFKKIMNCLVKDTLNS